MGIIINLENSFMIISMTKHSKITVLNSALYCSRAQNVKYSRHFHTQIYNNLLFLQHLQKLTQQIIDVNIKPKL